MFNTFPGKYISQSENAKVDVDVKNSSKNIELLKLTFLKICLITVLAGNFGMVAFCFYRKKDIINSKKEIK